MRTHCLSRDAARRRGFTLVEIILVVTIIMILVSLAAPRLIDAMGRSKARMTRIEIASVAAALAGYDANVGELPTTQQGLLALVERPSGVSKDEWVRVMDRFPLDAWGREFKYVCPGTQGRDFDIISSGKDGRFDTPDDLINDPPLKRPGA